MGWRVKPSAELCPPHLACKAQACCHGEDAVNPKCSQSKPGARVRPALQFWNPNKSTKFQQPGRILFYLPFRLETGGPEALHQLHNTINQLHYTGFIGMKSSFSNGLSLPSQISTWAISSAAQNPHLLVVSDPPSLRPQATPRTRPSSRTSLAPFNRGTSVLRTC